MSLPREILPGTTYLLSRRCLARKFLLRPSPVTNAIFSFCLAVAAIRSGVLLHAACVLSNHYHIVLTDPDARLPEFVRYLNEFVAKCMNARLARWEVFFSPGSYSAVRLESEDAILDKLAYVLANPVTAGLVTQGHQWPGLRLGPRVLDRELECVRPVGFFRQDGPVPDRATLRFVKPPAFSELADEDFAARLETLVFEREALARREMATAGRRFLGRRAVLAQDPEGAPNTPEPHRVVNPRVACRDKWKRIEALQRLRAFLDAYRTAYLRFREGLRKEIFPFGTYGMRVFQGVECAAPS